MKSEHLFHRSYTGIHRLYFEASEAPSIHSELFLIFFLTFDFSPLTFFVDGCRITPCNTITQGGMTPLLSLSLSFPCPFSPCHSRAPFLPVIPVPDTGIHPYTDALHGCRIKSGMTVNKNGSAIKQKPCQLSTTSQCCYFYENF